MRTRWALLILFWLGWLGMLAGAIAIIIQAPRCEPLPALDWWNLGPLYQVGDVAAFTEAGNLKGKLLRICGHRGMLLQYHNFCSNYYTSDFITDMIKIHLESPTPCNSNLKMSLHASEGLMGVLLTQKGAERKKRLRCFAPSTANLIAEISRSHGITVLL